jgi:hypothetical protein
MRPDWRDEGYNSDGCVQGLGCVLVCAVIVSGC